MELELRFEINTGSTASGVVEVSVACQKGYYLADGVWVPICKDGYFADQIIGWCVKWAWNCNTCTNYMDKCNNKCSVGTFSTANDRWEYPLSSSPIITVDATKNTINVKFPANTAILNMIGTNILSESIYDIDNVCGDETFNSDWSDFFMSSLNIDYMVSDLKSKLNSNEQKELDYLETGLYLPGKPITVLSPQVSGSSPSKYSEAKVREGPCARENSLYILPPPILG